MKGFDLFLNIWISACVSIIVVFSLKLFLL